MLSVVTKLLNSLVFVIDLNMSHISVIFNPLVCGNASLAPRNLSISNKSKIYLSAVFKIRNLTRLVFDISMGECIA